MNKITSVSNQKIKEYSKLHQKKYRVDSELFIVEGLKSFEEINNLDIDIVDVFILDSEMDKINITCNATFCTENVMKKLSSTDSVPSIITVAKKPKSELDSLLSSKNIALLEDIKDAGNLGTIIRSAAAFGIDGIILCGDTVDLYNQKVIRSSAGNFFKIPIINHNNIEELKSVFRDFKFISTDLSGKPSYKLSTENKDDKKIIMFGSEADGISKKLSSQADYNYLIHMDKSVESLNLSVAASIVFYEIYKSSH